jgi:hypothetical protein
MCLWAEARVTCVLKLAEPLVVQAINKAHGGTQQAEASAADREAALAAAHRQLSLKAGSAEAQHLDMQAQCTFMEAALKVRMVM